jgi:2-methylisoborneol synthase
MVTALLAKQDPATSRRLSERVLPTGPTGLGTSAARLFETRPTNGSGVPELYCPPVVRDDPALGEVVNVRLVAWAEQVGIYPGRLDDVRAADFGRLMMLCHPETDDPDRLVAAGKCALAEWATDDHYCDDESAGASSALLGARLGVATTVLDPTRLPADYHPQFEASVRSDPVLVALRAGIDHLSDYASRSQIARLRAEVMHLFLGYSHEASWRLNARVPSVWEYLACRQNNSFRPCLALVDVVAGYVLPDEIYADPRVRRAFTMAGTAATLVNDLYSLARERDGSGLDYSLPTVIAAEEKCSLREAVDRTVRVHDELVRTFEAEAAALSAVYPPPLQRFFAGVWAWLGGNRAWHSQTPRYNAT